MAKKSLFIVSLAMGLLLFSCVNTEQNSVENTDSFVVKETSTQNTASSADDGFRIKSKEDFVNYVFKGSDKIITWESAQKEYLFFRQDGTMAGGGPGGEETMWEGKWSFSGDMLNIQVTMEPSVSTKKSLSGTIKVEMFPDEGALILNGTDYYPAAY